MSRLSQAIQNLTQAVVNRLRGLQSSQVGAGQPQRNDLQQTGVTGGEHGHRHGQVAEEATPANTVMPFDPHLLTRARTQWQFGDWQSLAQLAQDQHHLAHHPQRAELRILATAGALQTQPQPDAAAAKAQLKQSLEEGASREAVARMLIAGVHNSLAKGAALAGRPQAKVLEQFEQAQRVGLPGVPAKLTTLPSAARQLGELKKLAKLDCMRLVDWYDSVGGSVRFEISKPGKEIDKGLAEKQKAQGAKQDERFELLIRAHLENLALDILSKGREMVLDGVRVFDTKDPFRPGKLALAFSNRVMDCEPGTQQEARACLEFAQIVELNASDPQETWGIYYYLLSLVNLKNRGVLEKTVTAPRLEQLRQLLDWRGFVEEDNYQIKGKPNNFYGVAFGIAEHRAALGWDSPVHGEILLQRMLHHYRKYSYPYGFADETEGHGRYDRYSVLLIAEIVQQMRETGRQLTLEIQTWLRNSAQFVLVNLNENGDGFQFGRSIGAYGDTAFLEILTAAAWCGALTQLEARMAYAFCRRATRKFLDFWYDGTRQSVNLWEDGRSTDGYRGKNRILGENLSLLRQHIHTNRIWKQLGFKPSAQLDEEFSSWLDQLPRHTLTRFSNEHGSKATLTARDGNRVFSLWLINPDKHHANGAYAPAPFSAGLIQAMTDQSVYPLTPIVVLEDGTVLLPMAYFDDIQLKDHDGYATLSCTQTGLATVKHGKLCRDERVTVQSCFVFRQGVIQREDKFTLAKDSSIAAIQLKFPVLQAARVEDHVATLGKQKEITFHVTGYDDLQLEDPSDFNTSGTPEGRIQACLHARKTISQQSSVETTVSWTLNYQQREFHDNQ